MPDLQSYLQRHFLEARAFAAACGLSVRELDDLIDKRLIPAPSYVVNESATVTSFVFGEMDAPGAIPGRYVHPATVVWVDVARRLVASSPADANRAVRDRFIGNFQTALADLNATTWRLRDSFADDGSAIDAGLRARSESAWEHFLRGTFGLCVANPVSEAAIARKEVLQEKLSTLSEDGSKTAFSPEEAGAMVELIDAYAEAAMPFSPIEYPISSRKRLVEGLRPRVLASLQGRAADRAVRPPRDLFG